MPRKLKLEIIRDKDKGAPVRFQGGTHHGLDGWLDESCTHTEASYFVIVDKGGGKGYYTAVRRRSVAAPFTPPATRLGKAIRSVPDIEKHVNALCTTLVKCKIHAPDDELFAFIGEKLTNIVDEQSKKKKPALVYDFEYWSDDNKDTLEEG